MVLRVDDSLILDAVNEEVQSRDHPETRAALGRLMSMGYTREDATWLIARVLAIEIVDVLDHDARRFDRQAYSAALSRLPDISDEEPVA